MQAIIVGILASFEMKIASGGKRIVRHRSIAMVPIVEGEMERGVQLPVEITPLTS